MGIYFDLLVLSSGHTLESLEEFYKPLVSKSTPELWWVVSDELGTEILNLLGDSNVQSRLGPLLFQSLQFYR